MKFLEKRSEPTWELTPLGGESREPHLPVESGLKGGDLGRESIGRACFVGKLDGLPLDSVGTAFDCEFGAASGHNGEESVAGGEMPWGERILPCGLGGAGEKLQSGKKDGDSERELEKGGEGGEVAPRNGRPRKRNCFGKKGGGKEAVIDKSETEGDGEEVKEGVVAGEGDEEHEGEEAEGGGEADFGLGKEKGKREKEFDHKGENSGELEKRVRELVDEPGEGVGNGLGFEVVGHGGEVGPGGVAAEEFDDSRAEDETCEKEGEGKSDEKGRNIEARRAGAESGFFEKDEEKTNFEEEGIPLEGEEILADIYEREPAEPREDGGEGSKQAGGEGEGASDSK